MQRAAGELFSHAHSFPPRIQRKQNSHHVIKHSCLSAESQMKVVLHEGPFMLLNISELPLIKASFEMWKSWSCLQIIIDFNGKYGNLHKVRKGCSAFYSGKISSLSPFLKVKVERNLHFVDCLIFCSLLMFPKCFLSCALVTAGFPELLHFLWPYMTLQLRFSSSLLDLCSPALALLWKGPWRKGLPHSAPKASAWGWNRRIT